MISGGCVAALFGLVIGGSSLRLRGDYLAIATLGFGEIVRILLKNGGDLTRGALGLVGIPRPSFFGIVIKTQLQYFVLYLIIAVLCIFLLWCIAQSPFGRVLRGISCFLSRKKCFPVQSYCGFSRSMFCRNRWKFICALYYVY